MKKPTLIIALCMAAVVCSALLSWAAYPEVTLVNLAPTSYDGLVVQLPSSRISFSQIHANSTHSIYFSKQDRGGVATYSLHNGGKEVAHGVLPYSMDGQLFRQIRLVIGKDGVVSASISG